MSVPERMKWWIDARFGMFIHWGVYAIPSRGEWIYYQEHWPEDEYRAMAETFQPAAYNPDEWVAMAQDAGMKYMVLTTRHHDGYCLYDSKVSDFTSTKVGPKRDLVAEYIDACRRAGMKIGLYYSLIDWRFPGAIPHTKEQTDTDHSAMVQQTHDQVRELMTDYGDIDILWYDGIRQGGAEMWRSKELNAMVRKLQPNILINNRADLPEDFGTPENRVRAEERPWESCYTMNDSWGYAAGDRNWKSPWQLVMLLASCVSGGGNLLMNVGPDADGRFPQEAVERLRRMGQWLRVNGEAIYGAGRATVGAPALGYATQKENDIYLIIERWSGSTVPFAWCGGKIKSAKLLSNGQEAEIEQMGDRVWLKGLPQFMPDDLPAVVKVSFDGEPKPSDPAYA